MKDAAELLKNPVAAKAAGEAVTVAAASAGVPLPPGVAEEAIKTGANVLSSSNNGSEEKKENPAPDMSVGDQPKPGHEKKDIDLSQSKGFEQTTMDIVEQYGQKITETIKADAESVGGKITPGFNFLKEKMSSAPDTPKPTELSSAATNPLEQVNQAAKTTATTPELNPGAGPNSPTPSL